MHFDAFVTLHAFGIQQDDVFSSPAVFNDTIFIGSRDNHLYALNRKFAGCAVVVVRSCAPLTSMCCWCTTVGPKLSAQSIGLIVTASVATAILVIIGGIAFYCQGRARRRQKQYGRYLCHARPSPATVHYHLLPLKAFL